MKKLLLLLLIAPMIGNSQLLNLPVSEVIVINRNNSYYSVPQGKVAQLVSSTYFVSVDERNMIQGGDNDNDLGDIIPRLDMCINLTNNNDYWWNDSTIYGNTVLPEYTQINMIDGDCWGSAYTFVVFDLNAQNLAYNVPNQTTPTLYPNPTSSLLALNSDKEYDIEVYDMAGNKVMALTGNTIDMSHLSSATYIVKALDKVENEEVSYKVVKN
ncbi:MAG: hypothetical protein CL832_10685 [Crocinitomicaceae bacterium]|nr:hypothetical protein [Crocinitomicaceae bacterium]RPG60408.1 MAG: T9SS C-terminal target domain-containing protein [Flavobacteriaceae bacterium TMED81]